MENHGLLVSAPEAQACVALHAEWVSRCERYFQPGLKPLRAPQDLDSATLRKAMVSLRQGWREVKGSAPFARLTDNAELASVACDERAEILAAGSLTPDHIVYTGARAILAESLEELPAKLKAALVEKAPPRVAVVRDVGTFLLADDAKKLDAAESLAVAAAGITHLASGRGGAHNLAPASAAFIINWEAEHYRSALLGTATESLGGQGRGGDGRGVGPGLWHSLRDW